MSQRSIFDDIPDTIPRSDWKPEEPPSLDGIHEICLNFETNGLKWWEKDRPIACAVYAGDRSWYLPWGHNGGNLDEATVKRWAERELRGKRITNVNTRFDIHMARVWGVDLEAQGNEVGDVAHYAALLDDHRFKNSLDTLIPDLLGETPMVRLDEGHMKEYHAGEAAPRARYNVEAVHRLRDVMWPMLGEQDLHRVRALEDQVIYVTCEMEKNGAPIDVELLEKWIKESQTRLNLLLWDIAREAGFQVNPDSPKDQEKVFQRLKLPIARTESGRPSFTDAVLKTVDHPLVQKMRYAGKLTSLRSKYLVNTQNTMGSDGILRYALHQMRASKDDFADTGEAGTVTGRYSSTELVKGIGVNIQQRMKAAKQRTSFGFNEKDDSHDDEIFLVRKLHIPASGFLLASDMDQAQYRIFASYANNPKIIQAYRDNPHLSFHEFMHETIRPYAQITYRQQKDTNFAYLFGAGLTKMALMLGHINVAEYNAIRDSKDFDHPKLAPTKEVRRIYEREVPEVKSLLEEASHLGKPECDSKCDKRDALHQRLKHRGYVKDAIGRRMRFPQGYKLHKAFNGVDQMTEASYMKTKLVELHQARHETGLVLRITNHDEVVGDIQDLDGAKRVDAILNAQSFPSLRVPLTWSTTVGKNWAETGNMESAFQGLDETRAQIGYPNTGRDR